MTLHDVVRQTLTFMKQEGMVMSPLNYHEIFCKEAKKLGVIIEDCNLVEKYLSKLDKATKNELASYHVRTVDELFTFLSAKINRLEPNACQNELKSIRMLVKRMADVATQLHNKELTAVANYTLEHLDAAHTTQSIDLLREKWVSFLTTYNGSYLDKLGIIGPVDKEDLETSIINIMKNFKKAHDMHIPDNLGKLLIAALAPSIASSMNDEIANISAQIRQDANVLDTSSMQDEIKVAIKKRIDLDKQALNERLYQLDEIADEVSKRLLSIIEHSQEKKEQLQSIKRELESIKVGDSASHKAIHQKLLDIATLLETQAHALHTEVQSQQQKIAHMDKKIMALESELSDVTKEAREDFLTGVYNKRALEEKLRELNALYRRYGRDYSVLFLDIDYFKKINDTYGHDAGDAVLKTFAKILKKESRANDFVGRFGGEEFVIILPETALDGVKRFATKLRLLLEKSRFVYKEQRIALTVSGGIALRSDHDNNSAMIKAADALLYDAKQGGRNQVLPL